MLSIGEDILQFYPNFALFSRLGGMNLDHDFVQVSKLSEDQKKKVVTKNEHFFPQIQMKTKKKVFIKNGTLFSPISSGHLRSDAHQSQTIGGDADLDHIQTIGGGGYSQIIEGYIPPSPRVSAPLVFVLLLS